LGIEGPHVRGEIGEHVRQETPSVSLGVREEVGREEVGQANMWGPGFNQKKTFLCMAMKHREGKEGRGVTGESSREFRKVGDTVVDMETGCVGRRSGKMEPIWQLTLRQKRRGLYRVRGVLSRGNRPGVVKPLIFDML
jgi:hypothetical protein